MEEKNEYIIESQPYIYKYKKEELMEIAGIEIKLKKIIQEK